MKKSEIVFGLIKIPLDFFMVVVGFFIAFKLRLLGDFVPFINLPLTVEIFPTLQDFFIFSAKIACLFIAFLTFNHSYGLKLGGFSIEFRKILGASFVWFTTILAYYFLTRTFPFSRLVLIYGWILSVICIVFGRILIRLVRKSLLKIGVGKRNILILGNNDISAALLNNFKKNPVYNVFSPKKLLYDYSYENLDKLIKKYDVEEIIQTGQKIKDRDAHEILDFCREHHLEYHFVPDLLAVQRSNVELFSISGIPIMSLKPTSLDGWGKVLKRFFDMIFSSLFIILLSPVFVITTLAIKIDSKGPVLFTKLDDGSPVVRVGEKGKLFKFLKFRSMHDKTHSLRYGDLAAKSHREGPLVKIKNDPRITKVGKFIRKYSIDELPQLFNVFIGNLSLVGPRAHLPEEVARYERHHKFVLTIKPGVTGISQTSGRSDLDFEKEVQLDTYYIENWSPWMDIKILFKTVFVVLGGKGAD